jgi:hypothetical protein
MRIGEIGDGKDRTSSLLLLSFNDVLEGEEETVEEEITAPSKVEACWKTLLQGGRLIVVVEH